ncbi:hypothetical protein AC1031_007153 [Aphanomyces cochlioides]|nr:hypothetical protein AC1031_007153 [Aphanomyces cochlioides]
MLQKSEYKPLYSSDNSLPIVRPTHNARRWINSYGFPLLVALNVSVLAMVGVMLHRSVVYDSLVSSKSLSTKSSFQLQDGVAAFLPAKFSVDHVTPYKDQAGRGTCWDFGTIGALEQSYRKHGVEQGWLQPDEYVAFSEQAYGIEVMELCTGPKDSPQQAACRIADDNVWRNSTEGGEVPLLYYLQGGLTDSVYPSEICPYALFEGHDWECPALHQHKGKNPLSFEIKSMGTYYDEESIKQKLVRSGTAMPLSTNMVTVGHFYPCVGEYAKDPRCAPDACSLCPPELPMATCCIPADDSDGNNMEGEFLAHSGMELDGGHVMLLVAYNDVFRTREGATGGFIVKNSWADGWQGSHSLQYWMQNISEWEERVLCPNSFNPFNWYMPSEDDGLEGIASCLSDDSTEYAKLNRQPLHLECIDDEICVPGRVYFAKNRTTWGDRMHIMCFWEYDSVKKTSRHLCLKPMLQEAISDTFRPVEVYQNDPDLCGFYFLPYETVRRVSALFQGFFVTSFDVEWAPQSYAANQERYPHLDYSLLRASTKTQRGANFDGPFPYAKLFKRMKPRHHRKTP